MRYWLPAVLAVALVAVAWVWSTDPKQAPKLYIEPEIRETIERGGELERTPAVREPAIVDVELVPEPAKEASSGSNSIEDVSEAMGGARGRPQLPDELEMDERLTRELLDDAEEALDNFHTGIYEPIAAKSNKDEVDRKHIAQADILYSVLPDLHKKVEEGAASIRVRTRYPAAPHVEGMNFSVVVDKEGQIKDITYSIRGRYSFLKITLRPEAVDPAVWGPLPPMIQAEAGR